MYNNKLIDPAILSIVMMSGLDVIEIMGLTSVDDISVKYSDVRMIQSIYKYS